MEKKKFLLKIAVAFLLLTMIWPLTASQTQQSATTTIDLGIEPLKQRKDTRMLCLGGCPISGPHAWDVEHGTTGSCSHCGFYCVVASISMIVKHFNGNLPQDRTMFFYWEERLHDGPENDLGHGGGPSSSTISETLSWALNGASIQHQKTTPSFEQIKQWISENRPILRLSGPHSTVVDGVTESGQLVHVIDPASAVETVIPYEDLGEWWPWVPEANATGRICEPEVYLDTDGDGVVDFDETERFHTDKNKVDTDNDGIDDKTEIKSYTYIGTVFDNADLRVPDVDEDDQRAEIDWDTDNGGASDGDEDLNKNGVLNAGETDPFDASDDPITPVIDVSVKNITFDPEYPIVNETMTISVTVENLGNTQQTFSISLNYTRIFDPLIGTKRVTLGPGQTLTVNFTWTTEIASRYLILAYTSDISDIDPSDNEMSVSIYVATRRYVSSTSRSESYDDDTMYYGSGLRDYLHRPN